MNLHSPEFERRLRGHLHAAWKRAHKRHGSIGADRWTRHRTVSAYLVLAVLIIGLCAGIGRSHWSNEAHPALFGILLTCVMLMSRGADRAEVHSANPRPLSRSHGHRFLPGKQRYRLGLALPGHPRRLCFFNRDADGGRGGNFHPRHDLVDASRSGCPVVVVDARLPSRHLVQGLV